MSGTHKHYRPHDSFYISLLQKEAARTTDSTERANFFEAAENYKILRSFPLCEKGGLPQQHQVWTKMKEF